MKNREFMMENSFLLRLIFFSAKWQKFATQKITASEAEILIEGKAPYIQTREILLVLYVLQNGQAPAHYVGQDAR